MHSFRSCQSQSKGMGLHLSVCRSVIPFKVFPFSVESVDGVVANSCISTMVSWCQSVSFSLMKKSG